MRSSARSLLVVALASALALATAGCRSDEETAAERGQTPSASPTSAPTARIPPAETPPTLRPMGVGELDFGTAADDALARLTTALGSPDEDSGWVPAFSAFGTCPGREVRGVRWGRLRALLGDGATPYGPMGVRHFYAWEYAEPFAKEPGPVLATPEGITLGSTVAELSAAFGDILEADHRLGKETEPFGPSFVVHLIQPAALGGYFTDVPEAEQTVNWLWAGQPCGE